jgi:CBS domain-containing protein
MICPSCGFENIQGNDECANCGADLRLADIPAASNAFEASLVGMPLAAVRHHTPLTIDPGAPAADAVQHMRDAGVGCLLVEDAQGTLRGILSERDLLLKLPGTKLDGVTVSDLMTADPVVLRNDDSVGVALHKMAVGGFRHIPLVEENGHATGIVSARDVFAHILAALK